MTDTTPLAVDALRAALDALDQAATGQPAGDPLPLLDRLTLLRRALVDALDRTDGLALVLTTRALRDGTDPGALVDRPYGARQLRTVARDLGIPPRKPGPAPRRARHQS